MLPCHKLPMAKIATNSEYCCHRSLNNTFMKLMEFYASDHYSAFLLSCQSSANDLHILPFNGQLTIYVTMKV